MSRLAALRAEDPRQLGSYRLVGRLGQGGQGVVYLAEQQVAVKLLHASVADDPVRRRRFLAEIEAVRRVAPFCTAQLLDADLDGDRPYLVSEYVDGVSLREHVIAKGARTGGSLDRLAIGTATAMGAIHRAGVVHRDFKPGNVLLSLDGPRVIDFGVSRLMDTAATTHGHPVGTPAYMAPEQIKGEPVGPPADLYAWALTVAFTANGRHAYTAETYQEVLARILYGKPDLGAVAGQLREIVDACLAPSPEDRPDAEEVLRRLLGHSAGGDVLTSGAMAAARSEPDITGPRPAVTTQPDLRASAARRPKVWQFVVAAIGLAAAAAGFVWWVQGAQSPGLNGKWTGSAEHPAAQRVFPVEISIGEPSSMRWGSDLHCSATLTPLRPGVTFTLGDVKGKECYPGTLTMTLAGEGDQAAIKVVRQGEKGVTYAGKVSRPS